MAALSLNYTLFVTIVGKTWAVINVKWDVLDCFKAAAIWV